MPDDKIQLFEDKKIRTAWDEEQEEWYFSIIDVVQILTDSADPKQYVKKMRSRDPELNAKWGTICTPKNQKVAYRGGRVTGIARQALEAETGKSVITSKNAVDFARLIGEVVKEVEQSDEQKADGNEKA